MAVRIRIAGYQGERSVHTRAVRVMMDALGAAAQVEFEPDVAARGHKAADLLSLTESGAIDMCYFSSSYLASRVPALGALDIPFLFSGRSHTRSRLQRALGAQIARDVATHTSYVALAFWDNGMRHLSNGKRPVHLPSDCAGLRIRTLPSAGYHATFRALGMEPVTIDVADMVRAIADGEVDAQENPLTNIELFGLQKYHRYVTITRHFHGIALLLCNAYSWANWPDRVRSTLSDAVDAASEAQWRFAAEEDIASRALLTAMGVGIVDLDDAELAAFRRAVSPVAERQYRALPPDIAALLRQSA